MKFSFSAIVTTIASIGAVSAFGVVNIRSVVFAPSTLLHASKEQYSSIEAKLLTTPTPVAAPKPVAEVKPEVTTVQPTPAPVLKAAPVAAPVAVKKPVVLAKTAPVPVKKPVVPATQSTSDSSAISTGIALGAVPLVIAPLVLLSTGRETLTRTKARRDELYEQIEKFEKAQEAAKQRKVDAQVDAGGLIKALGFLGAGAATLGLVLTSPFTGVESPKIETPKTGSVKEVSGAKPISTAPVSKISKPKFDSKAPEGYGYNFDIAPIDKSAPPSPPQKRRTPPSPSVPKQEAAPVAPVTPYYLKSKTASPVTAPTPKPVENKATLVKETVSEKTATSLSRKAEKLAPVAEGKQEESFAEKVVIDKAAREAAEAEAKAKAAEKAAAEAKAAELAAKNKDAIEQLEAKKAAEQAEKAKVEAEKVAAEKEAAAKAIAEAEAAAKAASEAAAKPAASGPDEPVVTSGSMVKETISEETLELLKKYNKK